MVGGLRRDHCTGPFITLRRVGTHSLGIDRGSLTWLDRHNGQWWAGFANYDEVPEGQTAPYGGTDNT